MAEHDMTDAQVVSMEPGVYPDLLGGRSPLGWTADRWARPGSGPDRTVRWWLGLHDDRPAGLASLAMPPADSGQPATGLIHVTAAARRRGLGTALRRAVEEEARGGARAVSYQFADDDAEADCAVRAWGLSPSGGRADSVLHLDAVDRPELARLAEHSPARLRCLAPTGERDWRDLYAFLERLRARQGASDAPDLPYGLFRDLTTDARSLLTAHVGEERVGMVVATDDSDDVGARSTVFVGVLDGWRRRGIATALTSRQALLMADAGVRRIHAPTPSEDPAMLAVHRRVGFVHQMRYRTVTVRLA